ncbi:GntR family transcriptional regulator [Shewanella sedimentimangrovi]|uniref:GntR family transcriptional regulator n=2 Tax=Shewanella TaxID=22 RepID=A0ABX7QY81_9GAMM|nr:GntR family transcriptional regulator [Shewanella sedimentimangrovi]QSX36477.1 GntR family transcriptional regulator [Shewanella sedimentimangrovi]QSX42693.1 GntR family transcriptional regulator [Shewanella cyperi]
MHVTINVDDPEPLFTQLIRQLKQAILDGHLAPGAQLPSIRQLANDLELNSKTVAKAYRLLERDGVIQSKGYRGTFVHPEARSNCQTDLNQWVNAQIAELIATLKEAGVTDSEIRIAFSNAMNN